jgi:hypothetical protein
LWTHRRQDAHPEPCGSLGRGSRGGHGTRGKIYKLDVKDVLVDAFWSVTVYDANGYLQPNPLKAYNLNSIKAKKSADGLVAVQFGGCDGKVPNCLPTMPGWNYLVGLYRPRKDILDGTWKFPEARPAS